MKKLFLILVSFITITGCSVFQRNAKYGCPTNGKNVGAEKIASGDKDAIKAARKAKKFKS
ncbi:hypothetical protein BH20BAC1_BH20BAC1_03280 [soil metagenome]